MWFIIGVISGVTLWVCGYLTGLNVGKRKVMGRVLKARLAAIDEEPRPQGNGVLMGP